MELDDLKTIVSGELGALTNKLESIMLEKGFDYVRSDIYAKFEKVVEDIHADKFVKSKARKFKMWLRRRWRGLFK